MCSKFSGNLKSFGVCLITCSACCIYLLLLRALVFHSSVLHSYVLLYLGPLCAIVLLHVLVSLIPCSFTFPCVITCSYTLRTLNLVYFFMLVMLFCLSCFWTHCALCSLDVLNTSYALLCNLPSSCTLFNHI